MRLVVLGASGQLGSAFLRADPAAVPVTRSELDLSRATPSDVQAILRRHRPTHLVNCAAYTAVDRAEEEEPLAASINGEAVGTLASVCADLAVPFVTYSTDYVFGGDGTRPYVESDPVDPINAYGRTKRVGEVAAMEHETSLVIRTSWVISGTHPNFVATMLRMGEEGRPLRVVDDQRGSPSFVDDLVQGTLSLLGVGARGVVHLTNEGDTTWHGLAAAALASAGLDADLRPCSTEDFPTPARRPAYSVLGSERRSALGAEPLPRWEDSLPAVVQSLLDDPPWR
jgi:dTDP-4-dehydrorhamnose reductase